MNKTLKYAFPKTLPVLAGYLFLGFAFGILLRQAGYSPLWAFGSSLFIYAGSIQFVLISLFKNGMDLLTTAFMTLLINGRHIFYGLSFLDKFRRMGKAFPYMVFSLTDETYSLLCSEDLPPQEEGRTFFTIALLDHIYWVTGSVLGALVGNALPFDSTGIDFAMTALFVVIFVEQWLAAKSRIPAVAGLVCSVVSLIIFGADRFIIPALVMSVAVLMFTKNTIAAKEGGDGKCQ